MDTENLEVIDGEEQENEDEILQEGQHNTEHIDVNDTPVLSTPNKKKTKVRGVPKEALIRGLFQGAIPEELSNLTHVEHSMISIYSAVTKVCILGGGVDYGKHHNADGGVNYTIINDLANVCEHLPRMPTTETVATLRHKNGVKSADYTYRPYRIQVALKWLVEHNHLYQHLKIHFPDEWPVNPDPCLVLDAPFMELDDDDVTELDNDIALKSIVQPPSTNTGKFLRFDNM
jgi:hypothetical protein